MAEIDDESDDSDDAGVEVDAGVLCGICDESDSERLNQAPEVSVVGSPLFTNDDRRDLLALDHQDQQGGNSESKHLEKCEIVYEDCTEFPASLPK